MRKIKIVKSKDALVSTRKYYLAYGLNTNLQSMLARCPDAKLLGNVCIKGYKLVFKTHCDIIAEKNSDLNCVLWSITQQCEKNLDLLEGYPEYYVKKNLNVSFQGKTVQALIYCMREKNSEILPSQNYLDLVVAGYRENKLDLDQIKRALLSAHKQETNNSYKV